MSINELLRKWLLRKDCTSSFLAYDEAGKLVLKFRANFSEVIEVISSKDQSNYVQIGLQVVQPCHLHNYTVLHVDQPPRDKPLKTALRSHITQHTQGELFQ